MKKWWSVWGALLVCGGALSGCVMLDETLAVKELSQSDLGVMCGEYEHGLVTCSGGWQAGFASQSACVETFSGFVQDSAYQCNTLKVGEIKLCLDVSPCERPFDQACEVIYRCVRDHLAEREGVEIDHGLF